MPDDSLSAQSGKQAFDEVYDAADPRPYWSVLAPLDYEIPQHAAAVFCRLMEARRPLAGGGQVTIADLCCSYGTNAALLKHTCTLADLCHRYVSSELAALSSDELAARDATYYAQRRLAAPPRVVGLDTAANAVSYALRAGLLDAGSTENLEEDEPSPRLQGLLAGTDLVTVTGGVGYIGASTFDRVLSCIEGDRRPWVAAFTLRWVDYGPVAEALASHGLVTEEPTTRTFPQRRFADDDERDYVLTELAARGIDPDGKEARGWHHATFHLSRPPGDLVDGSVDDWFAALG